MTGKLRIIAGALKGRYIEMPKGIAANHTRPTSNKVKEAIFSKIQHNYTEANIIDLFAGSGSLAIESLSRFAEFAHFVDNNQQVCAYLQKNIARFNLTDKTLISNKNVFNVINELRGKIFDIVFLDPPYNVKLPENFWLSVSKIISQNSIIIYESKKKQSFNLPSQLYLQSSNNYGNTDVHFIKLANN